MASELTLVPEHLGLEATIRNLSTTQQVFGRYSLRQVVGRGGMGVVWLAYDERLEREVALKFLPEEVFFDPTALDELKRETRRCLELTHSNIIRIHDFLKDSQAAAISMEYIDGKTLAALRVEKPQRIFEVEEIKEWILKVCQALHYAHEEAGVVHRDLKPTNLMVASRGQIKIADFGIAQSVADSISRRTMRRGSSGTLAYMSPQQMGGEPAQATDDVYALGATIYELLTSKPPFYSGDISLQVRVTIPKTMAERRQQLEIKGRTIPKEWENAIRACLAKLPEDRPKNMIELAERLGLLAPGFNPQASPNAPVTIAPRKKKFFRFKPPTLPRNPFSTKRALQMSSGLIGLGLIGWLFWHLCLWPIFAPPGELRLTSDPPGATVRIPGRPDQFTPATFSSLRVGRYQVFISEEGFDPQEKAVGIATGAKMDFGTIQLKRAFGSLNLTSVPEHVHYTLLGSGITAGFQKEGTTPDANLTLPSGSYQLSLTEPGFPSFTGTIQVPPHGGAAEKADLIGLAVMAGASPNSARAFRGEMDGAQLGDKDKSELVLLLNAAFEDYLAAGLLASASDQLEYLQKLGMDVAGQQQEIAGKRSLVEQRVAAQIKSFLDKKKYATAEEKLKLAQKLLEKDSGDRLAAQFQASLAQYHQQIDAAIQTSLASPPLVATAQLKTLVGQYPDDLNLLLAMAQVEGRMPPDHDRLTAQLKAFREFSAQSREFAAEPALLTMQAAFINELTQLDVLALALSKAKSGSSNVKNHLDELESELAVLKRRRVGTSKSNPFTQTLNFFGKAITGHSVVTTEVFFSSQEDKKEAIDDVETRIAQDQQFLAQPQTTVADAQKRYNDFVAQVPWIK